jgi:hypothetical protein
VNKVGQGGSAIAFIHKGLPGLQHVTLRATKSVCRFSVWSSIAAVIGPSILLVQQRKVQDWCPCSMQRGPAYLQVRMSMNEPVTQVQDAPYNPKR